ncbi:MAG TPA: hypothetical protein VE223_02415 [Nitrososphaeraceae archaeon]|nr:hypothetical protein [Nitrososphaeraceae archaeon]
MSLASLVNSSANRLHKVIANLAGTPTKEKAGLPILTSPGPILE